MPSTRSKITVLTPLDPQIKSTFQKLKEEALLAKKQLFEEGSSSSSSIEETKIDNKWMTKVEQTMSKLAIDQGTDVSQPIRAPNTEDNQINFPSWVHNNLNLKQFMGESIEDPHAYLTWFLQFCELVRLPGINDEHIKFLLFPFCLGGSVDDWLNLHPHHSLTTWEEVKEKFLNHFFSNSRVEAIKERIVKFKQAPTKSLFDTWERYKALLRSCPCHWYNQFMKISMFKKGITNDCRRMINASTRGNYLNKTTIQVKTIIQDLETRERTVETNRSNPSKGMYELNA